MDRDALATGAGSNAAAPEATSPGVADSEGDGVINGRTVDRASGSRRVRNSVEACL